MNIKQLLKKAEKKLEKRSLIPQPSLEAEILSAFVLDQSREWLIANPNHSFSRKERERLEKLVKRRLAGEPIAYLIGQKEFFGYDFMVNKDVLIPRPETELLVQKALKISGKKRSVKIIDIGTGSGAIAIVLTKKLSQAEVWGIDISEKALGVARENALKHRVKVKFKKSDLLKDIDQRFDLIVANLPYLKPTTLTPLPDPRVALNGGRKGLELIKRLIRESKDYLRKNGSLVLEISPEQRDPLEKYIEDLYSQTKIKIKKDLDGKDRVLIIGNIDS